MTLVQAAWPSVEGRGGGHGLAGSLKSKCSDFICSSSSCMRAEGAGVAGGMAGLACPSGPHDQARQHPLPSEHW